ncbi:unnamed protein product [Urochloa humidicola]
MAAHLVSCCLPGPLSQSPAKAASSSPPTPTSTTLKSRRLGRSGTKPGYLGVQKNPPSLALCPATNNCVSTSEEISDSTHYAPPWNYNPKGGRRGKPISKEEAMKELIEVFVDDVEFWFPPGNKPIIQYRSASRSGFVDFSANKKRVKELRLALEKKGWASESSF